MKKTTRILFADNSEVILDHCRKTLELMGFQVPAVCSRTDEVIPAFERVNPDLVIMDIHLGGTQDPGEITRELVNTRNTPVIYTVEDAGDQPAEPAPDFLHYGYLRKPVNENELYSVISTAILLHRKNNSLKSREKELLFEVQKKEIFGAIIGESQNLHEVFMKAFSVLDRELNVLITGESGTGKELLARAIHHGGPRRHGPFVAVNCAAISTELADSLLFGHRKGAFTGAINDHGGYFEQAEGGTLFLDEIGDMNTDVQAKLLRAIEEKKIRRVGEKTEKEVKVRILSATNRDLNDAMKSNNFRQDLYYRLEEYSIHIPPLRERREDIPVLARHFLDTFCSFYELEAMQISPGVMTVLVEFLWPGNIRELKNTIQRSAVQSTGQIIETVEFPKQTWSPPAHRALPASEAEEKARTFNLQEIEQRAVREALEYAGGNINRAAGLLGISRATLYRKLRDEKQQ